MASFTLAPIKYGKVVGRFVAETGDGADADVYPDANPVTGTVTFTPSVKKVLLATGQPDPATVELLPVIATIDTNGYLSFNNQQGVWLVATNDTATNPTGFTYTVTYNLTYSGTIIDKSVFNIQVVASDPVTGPFTDLAVVAPVPSSTGDAVVVGPPGPVTDLTIGTVTTGPVASATITGTAPSKQLNLVMPNLSGGTGTVQSVNGVNPDGTGDIDLGPAQIPGLVDGGGKLQLTLFPNLSGLLPSGMVMFNRETGGTYPPRPTNRTDTMVLWFGPDAPAIVISGTAGMLDGVDSWFQTVS